MSLQQLTAIKSGSKTRQNPKSGSSSKKSSSFKIVRISRFTSHRKMASKNASVKSAPTTTQPKPAKSMPPQKDPRLPRKLGPTAPSAVSTKPFAERMAEAAMKNLKLAPCKYCGRKFQDGRLEDHERICSRLQKKTRKAYDSQKHRLTGTVAEPFLKQAGAKSQKKEQRPPNNWRQKHDELVQAILAATVVEEHLAAGGKVTDLPPPPSSDYSDYVQCPYCGRRFNETAAQRHIAACKDMVHNKPDGGFGPAPAAATVGKSFASTMKTAGRKSSK